MAFHRRPSNRLLLLVLFLFPNLLSCRWFPKSLPCDVKVEASKASVVVDCSERHLTQIPEGIPANATNLILTINHIPSIFSTSFAHLDNLTEIDFRCNCVPVKSGPKDHVCTRRPQIANGSFAILTKLKSLYLDGNQLSEIPRSLPPNLLLLSLEANSIFSLTKEKLSELRNIKKLYLGQNCYYRNPCNISFEIEENAFQDLKSLIVLAIKLDAIIESSFLQVNMATIPYDLFVLLLLIQPEWNGIVYGGGIKKLWIRPVHGPRAIEEDIYLATSPRGGNQDTNPTTSRDCQNSSPPPMLLD
ncbi:toll-like receptor 7 isoform C [Alligator mississippiensis]|uniref:Toll-like receptor 7 isoform C n=1 Tax=Alligator mississippiensis TaxID=8496 RepID=A0A151N0H5_ALLMI|nr:toll-like receptor 7 isoform C [Alligator mississippiensis]